MSTDPTYVGFVTITQDVQNSRITCNFQNQQDRSNKSCSVTYGECGKQKNRTLQVSSNSKEPNIVQVNLDISDQAIYCYTVNASNSTHTILIEGNITKFNSKTSV